MSKPFRFRYVNETAGGFVLAIGALLIASVIMVGRSQRWFQPVQRLTIILPEEGSLGLRPGAEVFLLGVSVGHVEDIAAAPDGRMYAQVNIRRDYSQFVHENSTAMIRKTFGVAGDAYVEISRGSGTPLPPGAVVRSSSDRAPSQMLDDLVVQLRDQAVPTLQQARATMSEYQKIAADLRDPVGHLQQSLARADRIAERVERGEGLAGKLLADPDMGKQAAAALAKANASLDQVDAVLKDTRAAAASLSALADSGNKQVRELPALIQQTRDTLSESQALVKDLRRTTTRLPDTVVALDQTLTALPGLTLQTQETMRQVQRLAEGAQRHWLLQPYIEPEQAIGGRIPPEEIGMRSTP